MLVIFMKKTVFVLAAFLATFFFAGCNKSEKVEISDIADLHGKRIGVQSGTTGETWAVMNVAGLRLSSFKTAIDAVLDLKNGGIDCIILDELPAKMIASKNPELKIVFLDEFEKNKEEYAIAVRKNSPKILNLINAAIDEMKANGDYDVLVNAFMPLNGEIVIPPFKSNGTGGVLKLGTEATFPPFEYVSGKDYVGFDISMGEKIAQKANLKLEVVDMAFDSLIPALQSGSVDFVVAGMSVTEERKKNVDFSKAYFSQQQVIIVRN